MRFSNKVAALLSRNGMSKPPPRGLLPAPNVSSVISEIDFDYPRNKTAPQPNISYLWRHAPYRGSGTLSPCAEYRRQGSDLWMYKYIYINALV